MTSKRDIAKTVLSASQFYAILSKKHVFQVGDFLLLHLLGQNMNLLVFGEILDEFVRRLNFGSNSNLPSAPSTLEMTPIYPEIEKYGKETET